MPESEEKPKRRKIEAGDTVYSPYRPPKKTPEGHRWIVVERHVDKGYPFRWRLEKLGGESPKGPEPETPVSPMYPTDKPPRENVPMGGIPRGDRDPED